MGKAKKTRKFAAVKRMLNPKDSRLQHQKQKGKGAGAAAASGGKKQKGKEGKDGKKEMVKVDATSSALFFKFNEQLGPPYYVLLDTNFINFSIRNKLDIVRSMMNWWVGSSVAVLCRAVLCCVVLYCDVL